jgi:hypothetical protein
VLVCAQVILNSVFFNYGTVYCYASTSICTIPAKSFRTLTNKYFMAIFRGASARAL